MKLIKIKKNDGTIFIKSFPAGETHIDFIYHNDVPKMKIEGYGFLPLTSVKIILEQKKKEVSALEKALAFADTYKRKY